MIDYTFTYNLPSSNSHWNLCHTMIDVRATLLPDNGIAIEFPMLPASSTIEVINWVTAIQEIKAIARLEFEMMLAVKETNKLLS